MDTLRSHSIPVVGTTRYEEMHEAFGSSLKRPTSSFMMESMQNCTQESLQMSSAPAAGATHFESMCADFELAQVCGLDCH